MTQDTHTEPAAALYGALAKAQGAFLPIMKNREVMITMKTGGSYRFRYADLEEITAKTRPALSANGLAMIQTIEHGQSGPLLVCRLMHAQGGMIASEVAMPAARDLGDPKAFGAAITYLRRYMVTAMLGVAADDDLDEDGQDMRAPAGPTFDADDAIKAVDAATTLADLETVWKAQGAKAVAAKDKDGHAKLKAAVVARKAALAPEGGAA